MRQTLDRNRFEPLVIDNGSTDDTSAVLDRLAGTWQGRLKVLQEARLGLSHARNRALAVAGTPIVAFIDADALAEQWAGAHRAVRTSRKRSCFGKRAAAECR